jgi:hypothetical protein
MSVWNALRLTALLGLLVNASGCEHEMDSKEGILDYDSKATQNQQATAQQGAASELTASGNLMTEEVMPMNIDNTELKPTVLNASLLGDVRVAAKSSEKPSAQRLSFKLVNPQSHGVGLQFNSGMTADLWLLSPDGTRLWGWSDEMMFTQALRDVTLASGETITVDFQLPSHALAMIQGPGYRFKAILKAKAMDDSQVKLVNDVYYPITLD